MSRMCHEFKIRETVIKYDFYLEFQTLLIIPLGNQ